MSEFYRRCPECGSWDRECVEDHPVPGCGCARCLSAAEEWVREYPLHVTEIAPVDANLAGQECGEKRATEEIAALRMKLKDANRQIESLEHELIEMQEALYERD